MKKDFGSKTWMFPMLFVAVWTGIVRADVVLDSTDGYSAEISGLVESTQMISLPSDRYCGWPTVSATAENELSVVFSGNRDSHICPWGEIRRMRSHDGGRTWEKSERIQCGLLDDRDSGILRLDNGDLVLFWFSSDAYYRYMLELDYKNHPEIAIRSLRDDYRRHYEKIGEERARAELGSFARRSTDGGKTWGRVIPMPTRDSHTPHGAIQLRDGRLMLVGGDRGVVVSTDLGRSWSMMAKIPKSGKPDSPEAGFAEAALLEGDDGVLRCYIRNQARNALYSESRDGGRTWSEPSLTGIASWLSPLHFLRLADGRMLLTGARRGRNRRDVFALVGDRNGTFRSFGEAKDIVLNRQTKGGDFGYASTAQNADGSLVTVFYAHPESDSTKPAAVYACRWALGH